MASLADDFSDREQQNWTNAWLALNITKSGLQKFVETVIKNVHTNIYQTTLSKLHIPSTSKCTSCSTANVLKCPTLGVCNRRGATSGCKSMHITPTEKPRPCPLNICDSVRDEIVKEHRYKRPSWRNTSAEHWACTHWEVAKCFMPPDGYSDVTSFEDTDFNGIISFMVNCKHFEKMFSFTVASRENILTKARDIGRAVRHSSSSKITDADLQYCLTTLTTLLCDPVYLAQDNCAQEASRKIKELSTDRLEISTLQMTLKSVSKEAQNAIQDIQTTTRNVIEELKNAREELDRHFEKHSLRDSSYKRDVEDFRRRLKMFYRATAMYIPVSPLAPCTDTKIMDIYADPLIHSIVTNKFGEKVKRSQVLQYKDIFYTEDTMNHHIFLQGEAFTGKSTFAAKLVSDWCNHSQLSSPTGQCTTFKDTETLEQYVFVFLVRLRDSFDREIIMMIKEQIIDMIYAGEGRDSAYILLQTIFERERCLVLQDGLDEWRGAGSKTAMPILRTSANQHTVLTTTRPWIMTDDRIKDSHIDKLFEIEGISDPFEMSRELLRAMIQTNEVEHKLQLFKQFVHTHKLNDLISSKDILNCLLCVWLDGSDVISLCELYSLIIEGLMKNVSGRQEYFETPPMICFGRTKYIKPNIAFVEALSKAACFMLFSSERERSYSFDKRTLSMYISEQELHVALKSGILSSRRTHEVLNRFPLMYFLHKSIQEFLAAFYIATNEYVMDDCVRRYLQVFPDGLLDKSTFFVFLCGLNIYAANRLSCLMDEMLDPQYYQAFQRIVISGFKEAKANRITDSDIYLRLSRFDIDSDCFEEYCILKQLCIANMVYVRELRLNARHTEEIHSGHTNKSQIDIASLQLSSIDNLETLVIGESVTVLPSELAWLHKLKHLTLKCRCEGLDLSSCCSLETVEISANLLLPPNALTGLNHLKYLTLHCVCKGLDLSTIISLETIEISGQVMLLPNALTGLDKLKNITLDCLCDGLDLSMCHSLETIDISGQVMVLPNTLTGLDKLKNITLDCVCDGLDLSPCSSLEKIEISGEGNMIQNALTRLEKLKHLKLYCRCDLLDFSPCRNLETIDIRGPISLISNAMQWFDMLKSLKLDCFCDELDLSHCVNLESVYITGQAIMVFNPLKGLERLKFLTLNCVCHGLDLSSCINLETVDISGRITLLPNILPVQSKLKCLTLDCNCDELDLSSCQNLETISIFGNVTLLPTTLGGLKKVKNLTLHIKCDGLDLSSFLNLETLELGGSVTMLPEVDSKLCKLNIYT